MKWGSGGHEKDKDGNTPKDLIDHVHRILTGSPSSGDGASAACVPDGLQGGGERERAKRGHIQHAGACLPD